MVKSQLVAGMADWQYKVLIALLEQLQQLLQGETIPFGQQTKMVEDLHQLPQQIQMLIPLQQHNM